MKTFVNTLKVLSVAALVSSCAYENDPGLAPKADPNAKPAVNDILKGKTSAEVLTAKYKSLTAECSITSTVASAPPEPPAGEPPPEAPADPSAPSAATSEAPPATPPKPVDPQGEKVVINFIDQQKVDAELKEAIPAQVVRQGADTTVTVDLTVKPVTFAPDFTKKENDGKLVYVMKYTPQLSVDAKLSVTGKNATQVTVKNLEVLENIPFTAELARTGADREETVHTLNCLVKGEVEKPELQGQWLKVECDKELPADAKAEMKAAFELNCKKPAPPTQPAPPK